MKCNGLRSDLPLRRQLFFDWLRASLDRFSSSTDQAFFGKWLSTSQRLRFIGFERSRHFLRRWRRFSPLVHVETKWMFVSPLSSPIEMLDDHVWMCIDDTPLTQRHCRLLLPFFGEGLFFFYCAENRTKMFWRRFLIVFSYQNFASEDKISEESCFTTFHCGQTKVLPLNKTQVTLTTAESRRGRVAQSNGFDVILKNPNRNVPWQFRWLFALGKVSSYWWTPRAPAFSKAGSPFFWWMYPILISWPVLFPPAIFIVSLKIPPRSNVIKT